MRRGGAPRLALLVGVVALALGASPTLAASPAPTDVDFDEAGHLYVTDYASDRVLKLDADGTLLLQWGASGAAPEQLSGPFGVALDEASVVYVVDQLNHRVQRFTTDGTHLGSWGDGGAAAGQFRTPFDAEVVRGVGVLVADFGNDRVQLLSPDGQVLRIWGGRGRDDGQFTRPIGIAVAPDGTVYVSDHFNDRVQRFTLEGHFLGSIGSTTGAPIPADVAPSSLPKEQLLRPEGLVLDADGNLYVADYGRNRIAKFDAEGRFVTAWGSSGSAPGEFSQPKGVAIEPVSGAVYVADTGNGRLQRFTPDGMFEAAWPLP